MVLIYHYFDFMGKSGLAFDMVTSTEELAEEWIKLYGTKDNSKKYCKECAKRIKLEQVKKCKERKKVDLE